MGELIMAKRNKKVANETLTKNERLTLIISATTALISLAELILKLFDC